MPPATRFIRRTKKPFTMIRIPLDVPLPGIIRNDGTPMPNGFLMSYFRAQTFLDAVNLNDASTSGLQTRQLNARHAVKAFVAAGGGDPAVADDNFLKSGTAAAYADLMDSRSTLGPRLAPGRADECGGRRDHRQAYQRRASLGEQKRPNRATPAGYARQRYGPDKKARAAG